MICQWSAVRHETVDPIGWRPGSNLVTIVDGSDESRCTAPSRGNGVAPMAIDMADRTNEDQDLALVEELVAGPAGIILERIQATPAGPRLDFRMLSWRGFAGFCEVKSPHDDWLDEQLGQAPPMTVVGGVRPDPTFRCSTCGPRKFARGLGNVGADRITDVGRAYTEAEIATAIARCAGCPAEGFATLESIDSIAGRAEHPLRWQQPNLLRPLNMSYDASAGGGDRQPLLCVRP